MNRKKFGVDRVLTPEKAPYKVEGYYFHSCRGQMTILTGYHLGSKKTFSRKWLSFRRSRWLPLERANYFAIKRNKMSFSLATT